MWSTLMPVYESMIDREIVTKLYPPGSVLVRTTTPKLSSGIKAVRESIPGQAAGVR